MLSEISKLLVELGALKLTPRSGWLKAGIKIPESVAEHSFRTAVIAYVLSKMEGMSEIEAGAVAFLALLHDSHEARTLDLHKLAKKYVKCDEEEVQKEQLKVLELEKIYEELEKSGIDKNYVKEIIKDSDRLELLLQAREYSVQSKLAKYFEPEKSEIKTKSGKLVFESLKRVELKWWE